MIGWLVLEVTGSSEKLGLVIFLYGVPNLGFCWWPVYLPTGLSAATS